MNVNDQFFYKNGHLYKTDKNFIYVWVPTSTPGLGEMGGFFKKIKKVFKKVGKIIPKPIRKILKPIAPFLPYVGTALLVGGTTYSLLKKKPRAVADTGQQIMAANIPVPVDNTALMTALQQLQQQPIMQQLQPQVIQQLQPSAVQQSQPSAMQQLMPQSGGSSGSGGYFSSAPVNQTDTVPIISDEANKKTMLYGVLALGAFLLMTTEQEA